MPHYDYVCDSCSHEFEIFQSMSADHLTACPKCEQESLRRKIGIGAGIIFKGSGFYETDYKYKSKPGSEDGAKQSEVKESKDGGTDQSATSPAKEGDSKSGSSASPSPKKD